jgi:hypothetical protein
VERQRWLLGQLINPAAGGLELPEVLVALDAINEADLRDLFNDGGRLWASLDMAFVGTGPLLRQYHDLLGRRFTGGRKALAAGRVVPARMLRRALIGPVPGVPELARLSLAQPLTARQVARVGGAIADRTDDRIIAAVNRAGRPLSPPDEAELRSWLAGVRTRAADGVAADESWRHHEERGAWWFEPAGLPVSQRAPGRWAADATLADLAREIRRFLGVPEERRAEPRPADTFDLLPRHAWQIARAADGGQR